MILYLHIYSMEHPILLESVMSPDQIADSKKREQEWLAKHPELKVKNP